MSAFVNTNLDQIPHPLFLSVLVPRGFRIMIQKPSPCESATVAAIPSSAWPSQQLLFRLSSLVFFFQKKKKCEKMRATRKICLPLTTRPPSSTRSTLTCGPQPPAESPAGSLSFFLSFSLLSPHTHSGWPARLEPLAGQVTAHDKEKPSSRPSLSLSLSQYTYIH